MDSGVQSNICGSIIPFTLEAIPHDNGVPPPKTKIKALNLFPLTPSSKAAQKGRPRRKSTTHGPPRPKSSIYKGVTRYKRTARWEAHIWNKGEQVYLGASATEEAAARAYDRAALQYRNIDAKLNFSFETYAGEFGQLRELSHMELRAMLRKQSAGDGTLYPEYPPVIKLQLHTPKLFGVPMYFIAKN